MDKTPYISKDKDTKPEYFDIFLRGFSIGFAASSILIFALFQLFG